MTHLRRLHCYFAVVGALFLCMAHCGFAQAFGSISGIVSDTSGAVIPAATIKLTDERTGIVRTTKSESLGLYTFPSLDPSIYTLSVSATGFRSFQQTHIILQADQTVTVDATLQVGSAGETVRVESNPVQVNTVSGTLSQVIGQSQVLGMPLNGRNAASLTELVAGVVVAPNAQADQGDTKTFPVDITISANGTRVGETAYTLDGANNVDVYTNVNGPFPFPDALQEFSVQTSNYSSEYGENAGGVVNIVTKSGGAHYHGDLFEFVRNADLNAANYFNYENGIKTPDPLKRNQFGGTVGGPVAFPHLFHPKKTFFFAGWQSTIYHDRATSTTSNELPTIGQLAGTFANEKSCIVNPLQPTHVYPCTQTGATYTTTVNTADFSPVSLDLLKYLPSATATGISTFIEPTDETYKELPIRFDEQIGDKDLLTERYYYNEFSLAGVNNTANLLTYADQALIGWTSAMIAETHTFNAHMVNNLILGYLHENSTRGPIPGGINVTDLGVNIWQPPVVELNQIEVTGDFDIGANPEAQFLRNSYDLREDLHDLVGTHDLSVGADAEIDKMDINNGYEEPGLFTFTANNTGDPMASFLFGYLGDFTQGNGQYEFVRGHYLGFYVQDNWKLSRNFTFDYGLRWEPYNAPKPKFGRVDGFSPTAYIAGIHSTLYPNAPIGIWFAGDPGHPFDTSGIASNYSHIMPRLGFAWNVLGTGKLALRGGGGVFYDTRLNTALYGGDSEGSPFSESVSITNEDGHNITFADPYGSYGIVDPFPAPAPSSDFVFPVAGWNTMDPIRGFKVPVIYQWNLTLGYQAARNLITRVAYAGSHGNDIWSVIELNPIWNYGPNKGQRIYSPTYADEAISETNSGGNSNYNALELSAEMRTNHGLTFLANYTWSKSLDNLPYNQSATAGGPNYVYPIYVPNFRQLDYGPSDFDYRNVVSGSYEYSLPVTGRGSPLRRAFINGWQTTGLFQFRSGDPLTVLSGTPNNDGSGQDAGGTGSGDRAIMTGNPYGGSACPVGSICKSYLNPGSFENNPPGTYGTFVKGSVVGPQYADWDAALIKQFDINENRNVQFRAEYFNLLNHTNFSDPNTTLGPTFGQITGANDPRIAQLSLKLIF